MPKNFEQIHCQRCRAANPLGQELCEQCGTRLMLVVEPSTLRYEDDSLSAAQHEAHLVERLSLLENHLAKFADKFEQGLDLMLRQVRNAYKEHVLFETLIGMLHEAGVIDSRRLLELARAEIEREEAQQASQNRLEDLSARVLNNYRGPERAAFTRFVKDGFDQIKQGQAAAGVRLLQRAAALASDNAPLNHFIGQAYFHSGKMALARDYLSRAHTSDSAEASATLLLGIACGDEGDMAQAKRLLIEAVGASAASCFAARYALGRLHAAEDNWKEAFAEFKKAQASRPCAEAQYLLSLACYRLERHRLALRHALKALDLDDSYAAAFNLLGLIYLRLSENKLAREAFACARACDGAEKPKRGAARRPAASRPSPEWVLHAFFGAARQRKKRLLTGGDPRLAALLREDALAFAAAR